MLTGSADTEIYLQVLDELRKERVWGSVETDLAIAHMFG